MINFKLPQIQNVVAGQTATLKLPRVLLTLQRIQLALSGTFTKANITAIRLRIGTKLVYSLSGSDLDSINKYKGIYDAAGYLTIDFTERDSVTITGREVGGWDIGVLTADSAQSPGGRDIFLEFDISGSAVTPGLVATGFFTAAQGTVPDPKTLVPGDVIVKFLQWPQNLIAGRNVLQFDVRGAMVKRIYFTWTTAAAGNILRVYFKKNGTDIHDMTDGQNSFVQQEYRKVPQAKMYVLDWIVDNNPAADPTVRMIAEVIDDPDNN